MRNARPAASENTTVTTITTHARVNERANDASKSPTICCSKSFPNQCTDTPFIGKVRPPSTPWNDSTTIAMMGP